ncbi:ABC transporter ATP-binding protein [Clostridium botulinum]|uniref:ABC transporter ATP-binding protein n=1 Tax=Clostridium botulinum TaxID=1491 RepID=UPI000957AB28|nr:ABC transporter ATP-binding protein [Clostridium botulinum]APU61849.1 ABC transporter family protein [Clostridium botulinum]
MSKALEFKSVYKEFNNNYVLEDVSFTVFKNDIFGFLGPNGAGKTTTIRLVLDLLKATKGEILINECKHTNFNIRKNIGFCLDNDGLYENMSAYDNLEFFDRLYNLNAKRNERINNVLNKVKLNDFSKMKVLEFSKGMKKRLGLARALIINPKFLVLDEPLSGLDPSGQKLLKEIIKDLSKEVTIFFSSHNLNDVEDICNRVAILNKKIIICDEVDKLKNNKGKKITIKVKNGKDIILKNSSFLKNINGINKLSIEDNILEIFYDDKIEFNNIISNIMKCNLNIEDIQQKHTSLQDIYFSLIGGNKNG